MPPPPLTRRRLLQGAAGGIAAAGAAPRGTAARQGARRSRPGPYAAGVLPRGVRSRFVAGVNGLRMHVLEAGSRAGARAGVLLLHGFPELAYSWRRLMPALAAAGYHVMAPDLRGYGRTDGTDVRYDDDLRPFRSADWSGNRPEPLRAWSAAELARLPHYYVLDLGRGMAETVAEQMPSAAEIAACEWLPDDELRVYSAEYRRSGFQGGLQWYRSVTSVSSIFGGGINADLQVFAGRTIDQPSLFIAGARDWGIHQRPGALERMEARACTDLRGLHLLAGAGHWVQQEQSATVNRLVLEFLLEL